MSITKINGTIETQIGEHGRIKVVSFKKDGIYTNNILEIKKEFPPEGFIFAPHFFSQKDLKLNSLIEFPFKDFKSNKKDGDLFLLDYNVDCKVIGFPVFNLSENILLNEYSINQTILNNYVERFESQHFYIHYQESVYGPLKNLNTEILPKTGKEVCRYNISDLTIYSSGDCSYLISSPLRNSDLIDCMTSNQLNGWLKDQIKNLKLDIDFNSLSKALESQHLVGLDIDRMKRVLTGIDQISLTHSELKYLASSSEKLEILYNRLLKNIETQVKEEVLNPTLLIKNEIEITISTLSNNKEKLINELELYTQKLEKIKIEHDFILNNKNRLVEDIKVQLQIGNTNTPVLNKFTSYYEQTFEFKQKQYSEIKEFVDIFNSSIDSNENSKNRLGYNSIFQLKDKKYFLSYNIEQILQIAKLSNNCKVLLQQVEADWLKFENLFGNGLQQIWNSAYEKPHLLHFFILEDINIASIECFGKPLLDLIDGVRLKLPGLDGEMPKNLWIFGVPLCNNDVNDFGLPLLKNTYKNWGFFPKVETPIVYNNITIDKYLSVEMVFDHNNIIPSLSNEYFAI